MSDKETKPPAKADAQADAIADTKPPAKSDTKAPKPKKQWSNPALRMMGVPRFSLPSRNWMIFWTVLAGIGSGIAYDKYEQNQIRKKYMKEVEHFSQEVYDSTRLPRKLTIFVAPPPDDFLDVSMKYFRKYVKPILNSAAIDFDVLVANKQGDIRTSVSERIRQLRRANIEKENQLQQQELQQKYDKSWNKFITVTVPGILKAPFTTPEPVDEQTKSYSELYEAKNVLGYYYHYKPITPVRDDALDFDKAGGVVCVGRGAYKEYIQGIHEGLLGPLDPPEQEQNKDQVQQLEEKSQEQPQQVQAQEQQQVAQFQEQKQVEQSQEQVEQEQSQEQVDENQEEKPPKPYIAPQDYATAKLAPEFNYASPIIDDKQVPVLFQQPIYVFPVPNVLGFKNLHKKIYNFFTRRYLAQEFSERTMHLIHNQSRPFEYKDQYLAKQEELLWPKKWVDKGKEKNSEWVQELVVDDRVTSLLRVYE